MRHAERCSALLFVIDISLQEPWNYLSTLEYELEQFSKSLITRPKLVVANKIDLLESEENLNSLKNLTDIPIIPVSAKLGRNLNVLLEEIRKLYDENILKENWLVILSKLPSVLLTQIKLQKTQ